MWFFMWFCDVGVVSDQGKYFVLISYCVALLFIILVIDNYLYMYCDK